MRNSKSQNLLLKVDPLYTICNNKLNAQDEKLETANLKGFVSNIPLLPSFEVVIYKIRVCFLNFAAF